MLVHQIIVIALSHFVTWKLWKNTSKSSCLYYYNDAQKNEGFVGFEKACYRAKTYVILTSLNYAHFYAHYCWWRQFLWRPQMHICKVQKQCINSTLITWLIHWFLLVKTGLLITYDTAFYAIIKFHHLTGLKLGVDIASTTQKYCINLIICHYVTFRNYICQ